MYVLKAAFLISVGKNSSAVDVDSDRALAILSLQLHFYKFLKIKNIHEKHQKRKYFNSDKAPQFLVLKLHHICRFLPEKKSFFNFFHVSVILTLQ